MGLWPIYNNWLVVSNMTFIFHNIWDVILPIDELIVFKMVKTTNQNHQPELVEVMWSQYTSCVKTMPKSWTPGNDGSIIELIFLKHDVLPHKTSNVLMFTSVHRGTPELNGSCFWAILGEFTYGISHKSQRLLPSRKLTVCCGTGPFTSMIGLFFNGDLSSLCYRASGNQTWFAGFNRPFGWLSHSNIYW